MDNTFPSVYLLNKSIRQSIEQNNLLIEKIEAQNKFLEQILQAISNTPDDLSDDDYEPIL